MSTDTQKITWRQLDRQRSLERLREDGLVRQILHVSRDPRLPLFTARTVIAYEVTEVTRGNR